jgi:hypothetical protein
MAQTIMSTSPLSQNTLASYASVVDECRSLFGRKTLDYGTAWRILRPSSLTDQIFIKANRIRTVQEAGVAHVDEQIEDAFMGIVNYSLMALIQCELGAEAPLDLEPAQAGELYDRAIHQAQSLMMRKNHDYGEAWRDMRVSSLVDLILMKVLRVKQIEDNAGLTLASEGVEANYLDMCNYAIFALILLRENPPKATT